jgi:septum formation protein
VESKIAPMLVLASSSPRRAELLRNARIPFEIRIIEIPEVRQPGEAPRVMAERLAREKALAAARNSDEFVLAADTVVVLGSDILGKPSDAADAARMLRLLSGKTHQVITGVCVLSHRSTDTRSETTSVTISSISEADIAEYVSTGEPMDKAGAYAIQGIASRWISQIEGCYFNVVGLPVPLVYRMLREAGFFGRETKYIDPSLRSE